MDNDDALWEEAEAPEAKAEVLSGVSSSLLLRRDDTQAKMEALRRVEDGILARSMEIVECALRFAEIHPESDPEKDGPPPAWVEEMGYERALYAHRVARYSLMSRKNAPAGLEIARATMLGIVKARATEKGVRELNVAIVQLNAHQETVYEVIDETEATR